ncbi:MAG: C25 family cysteine peptidase, partial [Pyrinomonadaceae bacterium]
QVDTGTASSATALETASDDWLTDFNDDGIADISVGRLPVRTANEANLMVSKIVNYSPSNTSQSAMLVADTQGGYYFNFEAATDQVVPLLPSTMAIQKVYRRLQPSDADARANIISKLNSGQALTVYSGHGNVNIWGGQIFTSNDAVALTNGNRLPFVVVMDCLNGFFADPSLQSISEALLQAPNGGAVASFASSGLTIPDGQHEMGLRMFQLLYSGPAIPIGDASRQSKTATNDRDVRRTWILLGDPTLKIR